MPNGTEQTENLSLAPPFPRPAREVAGRAKTISQAREVPPDGGIATDMHVCIVRYFTPAV